MSLVPLIRFRNLNAQLTDNEFFNEFTKCVGRELITQLFFNHFKNNLNEISTITNIQSDIINKREENQQQILSHDCIDKLPSELISECASYLNYKQYFRLALCNRKTYIACYTFPKIQELYLYLVPKAMSESADANLNAFKNIQKLTMFIDDFNALSASNKSTWSNNNALHTFELRNFRRRQNGTLSFINNQHLINYNNVTTLRLCGFFSVLIYDILSKFTQVENLRLSCVELDNNSNFPNQNEIKKWFPNVKSLELYGTDKIFVSAIIQACHNQLESLSVGDVTIPSNITFPKLQSLELFYPTNVDLLNISQTLKCVTLASTTEYIINTFIDNTICKQLALENVTINSEDINSFSILQKIESLLVKNRNTKRKYKRLCIELAFDGDDPYKDDKKEFGLQIFRVRHALNISNIENWCLRMQHYTPNFDTEYLENELNEMKRNYFVDYQITQNELTIVVSNTI